MTTDYKLTERDIKLAIQDFIFKKFKDSSNLKANVDIYIRDQTDFDRDKIYARVEVIEEED